MSILVFSGSSRTGSINTQLAKAAAAAAEQAGGDVQFLDMADYALPLYNGDLEDAEGIPAKALELKQLFRDAEAFIIATPEYNSGITPMLKNVIDWTSRAASEDDPPLSAWRGKVAGLVAASPGPLGGIRGLPIVRLILSNIGVTVLPGDVAVGMAAFNDDGTLTNEGHQGRVAKLAADVVRVSQALRA